MARLGIEQPIVLAPMAAVAGGRLAAAVSNVGGLGLIGGGYADDTGWLDEQFDLAGGARVGCGFITWSLAERPHLLDVALEREPAAVLLSFGDPMLFSEKILASRALLLCQIQNHTQAERALDAGAHGLVAQGSEAGGHGHGARSTMTLVPEIADLVRQRGSDAVVLAAGGIADGRGLAAALTLGAGAALVGSRFYAAAEALSTPQAKDQVVAASGDGTRRTSVYDVVRGRAWPPEHTMNVLDNEFLARWHGAEAELAGQLGSAKAEYQQAVVARDYRTANVTVGQAAGLIDSVQPAADIVAAMTEQARAALKLG